MAELDRTINRCLLAGVIGSDLPDWVAEGLRQGVPGVTVFPGPHLAVPGAVARLAAAVRAVDPEALVSLDEEGGDVTRLEYATGSSYPGNLALGEADDIEATRRIAVAMTADLAAAGVNYNLAPSLDVNSDPRNPIIGVRSFGDSPDTVRRHGTAFIQAAQQGGVAVAAKHFPGHGDTVTDPHLALPKVDADAAVLRARELVPFAAAIGDGVASIMIAHALYPALDAEHPATYSTLILRDLLRSELGYQGVALSTAVAIEAGAGPKRAAEAAVETLAAGADLVLLGPAVDAEAYEAIREAIAAAVRSGELSQAALEESAERVERLRRDFAMSDAAGAAGPSGSSTEPDGVRGPETGLAIARQAARIRGDVRPTGPATVIELRSTGNAATGEAHWSLAEPLAALGLTHGVIRIESAGPAPRKADLPAGPLVLVVRDAYRTPWQRELTIQICTERPETILVAVGMPQDTELTQGPAIAVFGAGRANLRAAADLLAGVVVGAGARAAAAPNREVSDA